MKKTLNDYLIEHNITMQTLSEWCGVCYSHLAKIRHNRYQRVEIPTMTKIWEGTMAIYGEGLHPKDYTCLPVFLGGYTEAQLEEFIVEDADQEYKNQEINILKSAN